MIENKLKLRIGAIIIVFLAVGLILVSIVASRLAEPYIAERLCKGGTVVSEFNSGHKGGYYLYFCKDAPTGEKINITPDVGFWVWIVLLASTVSIIGLVAIFTSIIVKLWGDRKPGPSDQIH